MTWTRSPAGRLVFSLAIGFAIMLAVVYAIRLSGVERSVWLTLTIALAWGVPVSWLVLKYWRGIDEAAREAQKWAWFWGGTLGGAVSAVAVLLPQFRQVELFPVGATPADLMGYGVAVVMGSQLAGFFAAWIFWWWSKR